MSVGCWAHRVGDRGPRRWARRSRRGAPSTTGSPARTTSRDDWRCAGLAIDFHTSGAAASPGPIWAGQWLFVDEAGQYRVGSCTLNRGVHPTIGAASSLVTQSLPLDPDGGKAAYLTWRYGDTTDDLIAAAVWAVLHYYAQDCGRLTAVG